MKTYKLGKITSCQKTPNFHQKKTRRKKKKHQEWLSLGPEVEQFYPIFFSKLYNMYIFKWKIQNALKNEKTKQKGLPWWSSG